MLEPERRYTLPTWNYKGWGTLIGVVVVVVSVWLGIGAAALTVVGGLVGYLIGRFLDGELDFREIQERARQRNRGLR